MKSYLESAPDSHTIQLAECLQPAVQPFNSRPAVVDRFPLWTLLSLGEGPLVSRVRVNDRLGTILAFDDLPQPVAAVASVTDHVVVNELASGVSSLRQEPSCFFCRSIKGRAGCGAPGGPGVRAGPLGLPEPGGGSLP